MKQTKRNRKELVDIDIIDLNGGRKKSTGKKNSNREFAVITYFFLILFICLAGYFIYFLGFKSEDFINNPYNARLATFSNTVIRGRILSADGEVLAETEMGADGSETRKYPHGSMFSHAIGYSVNGMAGVELDANFNLLRSNAFVLERVINELKGEKNQGDDMVTTLNYQLQRAAYEGMGNYDGAVIALEPSTGKVLAMISKPDFNPNTIARDWEKLVNGDSSVLLNRTTQGLYPPGSTFKMITTLAYLQQNSDYDSYEFDCRGVYEVNGFEIHCVNNKKHGHQNLLESFGNSCNCSYSNIGLQLDVKEFQNLAEELLFNKSLPTRLGNVKSSRFSLNEASPSAEVMQTAIGQGNTLMTPLHMAMITSAVANGGEVMKPYMMDHSMNNQGKLVKQYQPETYGKLFSAGDAAAMEQFLSYVVSDGTASALQTDRYSVYGKTGTAEYNSDKDDNHSWFTGYARDAAGREIAVAVILEGAGSGSKHAVPLAKKMFDAYFQ